MLLSFLISYKACGCGGAACSSPTVAAEMNLLGYFLKISSKGLPRNSANRSWAVPAPMAILTSFASSRTFSTFLHSNIIFSKTSSSQCSSGDDSYQYAKGTTSPKQRLKKTASPRALRGISMVFGMMVWSLCVAVYDRYFPALSRG